MSSGEESQGSTNGGFNELGVQQDNTEEVPKLNLTLTITPEFINMIASAINPQELEEPNQEVSTFQPYLPIGVAMALACTPMVGFTTYIETTIVEQGQGKGSFQITGPVEPVMKFSAEVAYTVAKRILLEKQPENRFFTDSKLRLHVYGIRPVHGLSSGCTMITSFLSLALKKPVRKSFAMTGTVSYTGRVLQITGVREKTISAKRSQVKMIIFPEANRREFEELEDNVKQGLDARFVDDYNQIFELAFGYDH